MLAAAWLLCLLPTLPMVAPTLPPAPLVVAPAATPVYTGFWLTENQDAVVEIVRQGDGYVGRYVAFRKTGADPNSKALLRTLLLKDLRPDGSELAGKVIDPGSGKDYKAALGMTSAQTLELRVKALGMTVHKESWTRQAAAN